MSNSLKVIIAVAGALLVGLVVGFVLGTSGKRDAEAALLEARKKNKDCTETLARNTVECSTKLGQEQASKKLLLAKELMMKGLVELYANNYGLTSQYLGQARQRLKSVGKELSKANQKKVQQIFEQVGNAQTLVMKQDPMARVHIEKVLSAINKLPGAK